ncbi:MAG: dTMP kinase [Sedimentisphaerales bacterium]|nr:dTMP kinase [Sedimentisphaerales bacterium]
MVNASALNDKLAGKFIVLDGPDGCGKSTQARLLWEWIEGQGLEVGAYRDPGTTMIGERIREILLDPVHEQMADNVEVLLYMAARAQLWKEKIGPDLDAGRCVIMDRWISSTCAYQGYAGGFGIEKVIQLGSDCMERVWPDITIVLDIDRETAMKRMNRQLDRMEQKSAEYHEKVRQGFIRLAEIFPENSVLLDANQSVEEIHKQVIEAISTGK